MAATAPDAPAPPAPAPPDAPAGKTPSPEAPAPDAPAPRHTYSQAVRSGLAIQSSQEKEKDRHVELRPYVPKSESRFLSALAEFSDLDSDDEPDIEDVREHSYDYFDSSDEQLLINKEVDSREYRLNKMVCKGGLIGLPDGSAGTVVYRSYFEGM